MSSLQLLSESFARLNISCKGKQPLREPEMRAEPSSVNVSVAGSNEKDMCKICHCGASETSLISPCRCRGTLRYSHADCIIRWLNFSNKKRCELCNCKFKMKTVGYKHWRKWKLVSVNFDELLHILLLVCCLFIIVGSIVWWRSMFTSNSVYSRFFKTDSMRLLVYVTYGPLNLLCAILALLEIKLILLPIIHKWMILNQEISIMPYKSKSMRKVLDSSQLPTSLEEVAVQHVRHWYKLDETASAPDCPDGNKRKEEQHNTGLAMSSSHRPLRTDTQPAQGMSADPISEGQNLAMPSSPAITAPTDNKPPCELKENQ